MLSGRAAHSTVKGAAYLLAGTLLLSSAWLMLAVLFAAF